MLVCFGWTGLAWVKYVFPVGCVGVRCVHCLHCGILSHEVAKRIGGSLSPRSQKESNGILYPRYFCLGGTLSLRSQKLSKYLLRGWKQIPSEYCAQSTFVSKIAQRIGGNVKEVGNRIRILSLRYLKIISWGTVAKILNFWGCKKESEYSPQGIVSERPLPISQTEGYSILSEKSLCGPSTGCQHQSSWSSSP